jgi:type II secretory pathway component PulC
MKSLIALAIFGLAAAPVLAQEQDKDALKKKILKDVEEKLKKQDDRLLKDIEKMIDEELGAAKPATPKPAPAPAPKVEPKREPAPKADAPAAKPRGFLGIRTESLSDDEKKDLKVKSGIKIAEVVKDSPADKAGLKMDDIITAIDGRAIDSPQDVPGIIKSAGAGTVVKVEVQRDGKKQTIEVTLGRHPADTEQGQAPAPDPKAPDLRERVKKFLDKKEDEPKAEAPKQDAPQGKAKPKAKPAPKDDEEGGDLFSLDESLMEQLQPLFDQLGMDPDQFFDKGKDGKYRFKSELKEMFKNFDFKKLVPGLPGAEDEDTPPPPKKKSAPKKEEPKAETPKAEAPKAGPRPWLGIQPEELSDELRSQLDIEEGVGLLVTDVREGSPALQAGLKKNDILLKIDGKPVKGEETLAKFMKSAKVGQEATLTVLRKGKEQTLKVTLTERKE